MDAIRTIVIASDSTDHMPQAIEKACRLEHYTGAAVHIAEVVYDHVADESTEVIPPEDKANLVEGLKALERHGLRELAGAYQHRVATLETHLLWERRKADALLALAERVQADLLIKPVSPHSMLGDYLHTPLDWELMRQAPCPVLVSKEPWAETDSCVLACVDVLNPGHEALNERVLRTARSLAGVMGQPLHVVCVYSDLGQGVNEHQVAIDFDGIKAEMRRAREVELNRLNEALELEATIHVLSGHAAGLISALVKELHASVAVLGTAARTGLAKFFLGNTSEDLIGTLGCDVLAVRGPSGG